MQDKCLISFIKIIRQLIVLFIFIIIPYSLIAQETEDPPVFEEMGAVENSAQETALSENETESAVPPDLAEESAAQTVTEEQEESADETIGGNTNSGSSGSQNNDFDVFRPSEEISEDLAVPFPADI